MVPPFYNKMIDLLRNALDMLDEQGREEVQQFISNQQNADGGFMDRAGKSDLYYSLFGGMMLRAWGMGHRAESVETGDGRKGKKIRDEVDSNFPIQDSRLIAESLLKLKQFINQQSNSKVPGFIERCCLVLLQNEFGKGRFSRMKALSGLGWSFWKERHSINLSYRSFVLFLTLDAVFPFPIILKRLSQRISDGTRIDQHSPCSEVAAKVFLQKMMNQDEKHEQELLKSYACESGGFKAFQHLQQADMLSTAVALFALNDAGCDLRVLRPASLDFIQSNFAGGAFLSDDGDPTTDVEYTFYGLLALGVLGG